MTLSVHEKTTYGAGFVSSYHCFSVSALITNFPHYNHYPYSQLSICLYALVYPYVLPVRLPVALSL